MFSNSYNVREIVAHAFDTLVAFNEKFAITRTWPRVGRSLGAIPSGPSPW
jgi:hypothetical protein